MDKIPQKQLLALHALESHMKATYGVAGGGLLSCCPFCVSSVHFIPSEAQPVMHYRLCVSPQLF